MRYIHTWYTPIVVKADENWYYNPEFNPRHLPVVSSEDPFMRAIFDLSQWFSTNEDEYFAKRG